MDAVFEYEHPSMRILKHPSFFVFLALVLAASAAVRAELTLVERWPAGANVCTDAPLRLTFDKPPVLGSAGKIEVCRASDGQPVATVTFGEKAVRIDGSSVAIRLPARSLGFNESYFVRIEAGLFQDFSGIEKGWNFTTKAAGNPERVEVAEDGSGDFCTVQGAVDQAQAATIFIRKGRYEELVRVGRERRHLHLIGEDRKKTVIAYANNEKLNTGWIQRSVLGVEGDDFTLENLTVQNTTPYKGSQAEAVSIRAERCVLRNADFLSFQDTLNLTGRVYVADCYVEGDVDYVWGYGMAVFERCELRTMHGGYLVQARNPLDRFGYVFLDCKLTAAPEVQKCWLARIDPARFPASHVAFIRCAMGPHFQAAGWEVTGTSIDALRFEEFASTDLDGKPLDVSQRNPASKQLTAAQAAALSAANVLEGNDGWNPEKVR